MYYVLSSSILYIVIYLMHLYYIHILYYMLYIIYYILYIIYYILYIIYYILHIIYYRLYIVYYILYSYTFKTVLWKAILCPGVPGIYFQKMATTSKNTEVKYSVKDDRCFFESESQR